MKYKLELNFEYEVDTDNIKELLDTFEFPDFGNINYEFLSLKTVYEEM